jgi:SpoVK/Ycf46/Vps4 family AAA+-type ATPase
MTFNFNLRRYIEEAVIMPVKYPQFFHGLLEPWKGILLYGPPAGAPTRPLLSSTQALSVG